MSDVEFLAETNRHIELNIDGAVVDLRHYPAGTLLHGYTMRRGWWEVRLEDGAEWEACDEDDGTATLDLAKLASSASRRAEQLRDAASLAERQAFLLSTAAKQWLPNHRPGAEL